MASPAGTLATRRVRVPSPPGPSLNPAEPLLLTSCLSAPSKAELQRKSSSQSLAVSTLSSSANGRPEPGRGALGRPSVSRLLLVARFLVDGPAPVASRPPDGNGKCRPGFGEVPFRGLRGWRPAAGLGASRVSRSSPAAADLHAEVPASLIVDGRLERYSRLSKEPI